MGLRLSPTPWTQVAFVAILATSFTAWTEVLANENKAVMECVVAQVATESNQDAMRLRDQGRTEQSKQLLQNNAQWLQQNAAKYNSPTLDKLGKANQEQSNKISDVEAWKGLRKAMGKGQYDIKQQTSK